jgi:hypothetical protein
MENGRGPSDRARSPTSPPLRPWIARFAHAAAIEARRFAGSRGYVLTKTGIKSLIKTGGPAV